MHLLGIVYARKLAFHLPLFAVIDGFAVWRLAGLRDIGTNVGRGRSGA